MTQQLTDRQIAWRVAQDLPRGAHVKLGAGMPRLVRDYVAHDSGIVFERSSVANESPGSLPADDRRTAHHVLGAREVTPNGDLVEHDAARDEHSAVNGAAGVIADAGHVIVIANFFAADGRPTLVPACSMPPSLSHQVATLYTDLAVIDLRDGKAWLREIVEGITLHVLQAEIDVQLHVAPNLRLLQVPDLP